MNVTPKEAAEWFGRWVKRHWDLETLLASVECDARPHITAKTKGKRPTRRSVYAEQAVRWLPALRKAVADGNAGDAAVLALKVGASIERMGTEILLEPWLKQSEAAEVLGMSRHTVRRLVREGRLRSNGRDEVACRIDPRSVLEYLAATRESAPYNDSGDDEMVDDDWEAEYDRLRLEVGLKD